MCDKTVCERARTDKGVGVIEVYKRHEFDSSLNDDDDVAQVFRVGKRDSA